MDAFRIIITPGAGKDLEDIYDYIAKHSEQNAASMITKILDALDRLKQFPHRTIVDTKSSKLRHPVRSLPVWPYVVFFRVLDDENVVRVLHVRHGARGRPRFD